MGFSRFSIGSVALLVMLAAGCSASPSSDPAGESVAQDQEDLFVKNGTNTWNQTLPVCFHQSPLLRNNHQREMDIIRGAVERTWLTYANVSVSWNGICTNSGGSQLRINLGPHDPVDSSSDGQTQTEGMANLTPASTALDVAADKNIFQDPGVRIWIRDDGGSALSRLEYIAVHEFGHVLGFAHEQDSFANPNRTTCPGANLGGHQYGPWDQDSIMNYCFPADTGHGYLTDGDREGATDIYGFKLATGWFAADVNGDGTADVLHVTAAKIDVFVSFFGLLWGPTAWTTGPMVGSRSTIFTDVNGDGKADVIAVNADGTFVMTSDGSKFNWAGQWSSAFVGTRQTLGMDVNGDGKTDLVAVNNGGTFVMTSDGTKFNWAGQWSSPLFGSRTTLGGDVTGDHKGDIVTMSGFGLQVGPSTGTAFNLPPAPAGYNANSRAAAVADVNGDGLADYVAVNDWGVDVATSNGSGFNAGARWSDIFYGSAATLIADVNGDHKVDIIAVNQDGTMYVKLSNGTSFPAQATQWH